MNINKFYRKNHLGQTAVEYLLLLLVVISIMYAVMGRVKDFIMADADSCTEASTSLVCSIERMYGNNYRWFTIRR